jgi:hypothetical protein
MPSPPVARPIPDTAESLYARAEAAMAAGDRATARTRLAEVVRRHPSDPLADAALYELASLTPEPRAAGAYLDELLARGVDPTLREPAHFRRCRLHLANDKRAAAVCLGAFRRAFPSSPHDAEALALLADLGDPGDRGCKTVLPLVEEYLRLYPAGPFSDEARQRKERCAR